MKLIAGFLGFIIVIVVAGIIGNATHGPIPSIATEISPIVTLKTPMVKMTNKAQIGIRGIGFKAGQKVRLLFTTHDGIQADVDYALYPKPRANGLGRWSTTWKAGRFIKKKLVDEGTYKIVVTDDDYNAIAQTSVTFFKKPR